MIDILTFEFHMLIKQTISFKMWLTKKRKAFKCCAKGKLNVEETSVIEICFIFLSEITHSKNVDNLLNISLIRVMLNVK